MNHGALAALVALASLGAQVSFERGACADQPSREPDDGADLGPGVEWRPEWRKTPAWEAMAAIGVLAGSFVVRFAAHRDREPTWRGDFIGDFALQDAFFVRDDGARGAFRTVGDVLYIGSFVWPGIDAFVAAGLGHRRRDIAVQMFLMDIEAFAVASSSVFVTQHFVRRERPERSRACGQLGDREDASCDAITDNDTRSFPGGHVATVATTASFTCLHHQMLPLFGGAGDAAACATGIAASVLTGASRVMTDQHYVSDVVLGGLIGFVSGYVVPRSLHYGWGSSRGRALEAPRAGRRSPFGPLLVTPTLGLGDDRRAGLQAVVAM